MRGSVCGMRVVTACNISPNSLIIHFTLSKVPLFAIRGRESTAGITIVRWWKLVPLLIIPFFNPSDIRGGGWTIGVERNEMHRNLNSPPKQRAKLYSILVLEGISVPKREKKLGLTYSTRPTIK